MPEFVPLNQAGKFFAGRPHYLTCLRWVTKGMRSKSGERIKLRVRRSGRCLFNTREWCEQFQEALDRDHNQQTPSDVDAECEAAGL